MPIDVMVEYIDGSESFYVPLEVLFLKNPTPSIKRTTLPSWNWNPNYFFEIPRKISY